MLKTTKMVLAFLALMFACSAANVVNDTYIIEPIPESNVCIEGFALYRGMIYVVKSQIVPGEFYWEAGNWQQKHKRVWMEIYAAIGTQIRLVKVVEGSVIPPTPEHFDFSGKKNDVLK
jgi:hypothetical protein